MWTMTTRGFYSVVAHRDDSSQVMVRARCERDIRALADLLPAAEPAFTPDADYHWRLVCSREKWAAAVTAMAGEIDYANFKAAITDKAHHRAYLEVWHDLLSLTDSEPEPENAVMLDLAANERATYEPGDEGESTVAFIDAMDEEGTER